MSKPADICLLSSGNLQWLKTDWRNEENNAKATRKPFQQILGALHAGHAQPRVKWKEVPRRTFCEKCSQCFCLLTLKWDGFIVVDKREGNQRTRMSTQFPKSSQSLRGGNTRKPPCILKSIPGENIIPKVPTTRLVRRGFHLLILVTHIRIGRTRAHRCQRPPSSPPVMQCMAALPSVRAWIFMKEGHIGKIPSVSLLSVFFCFLGGPGQATLCLCRHFCLAGIHAPKRLEKPVSPPPTCKGCSGQWKPWTRGSCFVGFSELLALKFYLKAKIRSGEFQLW